MTDKQFNILRKKSDVISYINRDPDNYSLHYRSLIFQIYMLAPEESIYLDTDLNELVVGVQWGKLHITGLKTNKHLFKTILLNESTPINGTVLHKMTVWSKVVALVGALTC